MFRYEIPDTPKSLSPLGISLEQWGRETPSGLERARREGKTLGRRKVTNDTMTAKIIELRTAKKSLREIASEVGVSRGTVNNVLKAA
jgi:DNA invertase Pin-like site-specific DNA recombinase